MFVLINQNHDGDSYLLIEDATLAKQEFDEACADSGNYRVTLCEPTIGGSFGFSGWGQLYGADVVFEFDRNDEE